MMINSLRLIPIVLMLAGIATSGCAEDNDSAENVAETSAPLSVNDLTVTLTMDKSAYKAEDVQKITFTVTNNSRATQRVLKRGTPLDDGESDFFVVDKEGKAAPYLGRLIKRSAPQDKDYASIEPGQSVSATLDLTDLYDIHEAGKYQVRFAGALGAKAQNAKQSASSASSYSAKGTAFTLNAKRASKLEELAKSAAAAPQAKMGYTTDPSCNNVSGAAAAITNGYLNALPLVTRAYTALKASQDSRDYANASWFSRWFGSYTWDNAGIAAFGTAVNHFASIKSAFENQSFTFACDTGHPDWYAYVYPSKPYKIYLCGSYFAAPTMGVDTKPGTLIHETSHFNAVASTVDNVYGKDGCLALAQSDKAKALRNADSHEYLAEESWGHGWMMKSDRNRSLAVRASRGVTYDSPLVLSNTCTADDQACTFTYRKGMIVSDGDTSLKFKAYNGGVQGSEIRLERDCSGPNPDCLWQISGGMIVSVSNPSLAINAWYGAANGTQLRLNYCSTDNPDCTFMLDNFLITSDKNPQLAALPFYGATQGAQVGLHNACSYNNANCLWSYASGLLINQGAAHMYLYPNGGTANLAQAVVSGGCVPGNLTCSWTFLDGEILNDANWSYPLNALNGARYGTSLALNQACTSSNPDCTWGFNELNNPQF